MLTVIYETLNFQVESREQPHLTREDGGHLVIRPKKNVSTRQELSPSEAIEFMKLTMIVGEAMTIAMNNRGIDIGRINYQDNGNWSVFKPGGPHLHLHLYGRAKSAKIQKYGEAAKFPLPSTGFYDENEPFNAEDILEIQKQITVISNQERYQSGWNLGA